MSTHWNLRISLVFIGIPICSLIISIMSLLRYGIDIPYYDDWGPYITGNMGSLNLKYLFQKANDTLMPVAYVLESLAFRYLNGNTVAWQFLSMIGVLGLLLFLQWWLLLDALNDRLLAASAFTLTLLMLQPYSYWGLQSQAYIQALPLVFCLASIYLALCKNWSHRGRSLALFILGLLAGFSYISGAFAIMVVSIVFLSLSQFIKPEERKPILVSGWALFVAGCITTLAQMWVIVVLQKGTHRADIPMAFPIDGEFWIFLLGNIARSLRLHMWVGTYSQALILVSAISMYVLALIFWSMYGLIKKGVQPLNSVKPYLIFLSIFSAISIYLLLISAGRAAAQLPGPHSLIQVFATTASGCAYYFWVTLLWPWVAAVSFIFLRSVDAFNRIDLQRKSALVLPIVVVPFMIHFGMVDHSKAFKGLMGIRADGMKCLSNQLQSGRQDIDCPKLYPGLMKKEVFFKWERRRGIIYTDYFSG